MTQLTDLVPALGTAVSFAHDTRGSRTSSTVAATAESAALTTSYDYSPSGALASVTTPTETVDYTSDGRGLRQSRTAGSTTQQFTWSTVYGLPVLLDDGDHTYLYRRRRPRLRRSTTPPGRLSTCTAICWARRV
jgi:YD repeat-containing protein